MLKIVVAQYWTENLSYSKYTKAINEKYCEEMGYIYHVESDTNKIRNKIPDKSFHWYKPFLLMDVLEKYSPDYVLFLDADAIVVDNSYKIENFIINGFDIIVTEDYGPSVMNSGVILLKNTEWVKLFLQRWFDTCDEMEGGNPIVKGFYRYAFPFDQVGFSYLLKNEENIENKIKVIDNKILNGRYFKDTINNNFIFHAFSYGSYPNRTIDTAYHNIFNIPLPQGQQLLDVVNHYATDKHHGHNYFNLVYNDLFFPLREECKIFMEIGVYDCESIKLWRDYFVNSEIIGIEYNLPYSLNRLGDIPRDRMTFIQADQSNEADLIRISEQYSNIDVILDDGSHKMKDQQITLAKLFKSLKSGGIYVLEDLHTSLEIIKPGNPFDWGDKNKTLTLDMLKEFDRIGKIQSDYMSNEDMEYLNQNIDSIQIFQNRPDWSITSVIRKK